MPMPAAFQNVGFGEHRGEAVALLAELVRRLEAWAIPFFLISGTLLGHVRHGGDFIPWDDDIDLLVSARFVEVLPELQTLAGAVEEEARACQFTEVEAGWVYKFSFCKEVLQRVGNNNNNSTNYTWPFVDLFVFAENVPANQMHFFGKPWPRNAFFPPRRETFADCIQASIPCQPDVFLRATYGDKYMQQFLSPDWNHRTEKKIKERVMVMAAKKKEKKE